MGANRIWKVTCKKAAQKVPVGLTVEIVKTGATGCPSAKEIKAAIKEKYGIEANEGLCSKYYFDITDLSKR